MLRWSNANAKIQALSLVKELKQFLKDNRKVYSFDLASGHSCPFAKQCLSKVVDGKIVDGPDTEFRCFSASQEVVYPNVFKLRMGNFNNLRKIKTVKEIALAIHESIPKDLGIGRIHVGGDMFNANYMLAWGKVAELNSSRLFYAYTKSLPYWVKHRKYIDSIPNLVLTASYGGKHDDLIEKENLRFSKVILSPQEAIDNGWDIDHDDDHAANPNKRLQSFALLIHGVQPKGSPAGKAVQELRKKKIKHSYSKK